MGEFFIPVAFVILIGSIFVTYKWPALALPLMLLMYIYLFAVIIDIVIMWRKLKKKLIEKFGEQSVAKGMRSGSYAWSRAIQMRRWRLPKPRYQKRGHWPERSILRESQLLFQAVGENRRLFHYHVTSCNARINEGRHD